MSSIDYRLARAEQQLSRLTAQSKGSDPKQPSGGVPEFTAQDIQHAAAKIWNIGDYYAVTAKYCQNEISEAKLLEFVERLSVVLWARAPANRSVKITFEDLHRIAEAAVLQFLNPHDAQGNKRTSEWAAAFVGVHRNTFRTKYATHYHRLQTELDKMLTNGMSEVVQALRRDA